VLHYSLEDSPVTTVNKPGSEDKPLAMAAAGGDLNAVSSVYDFEYKDINGEMQSMSRYKGHVLIVVNVASK